MPTVVRSDWDATPSVRRPLGVRNALAWLVLAAGAVGSVVVALGLLVLMFRAGVWIVTR